MRTRVLLPILFLAACGAGDSWSEAVDAMNRGLVAIEGDRAAAAVPHFEAALAARPDWHEAKVNLAIARFHAGRADNGRLDSILAARPNDPHARFVAGVRCRMAGEPSKAREFLERLATSGPADEHVHCWLGLALKDAGRDEEAVNELQKAGDLRPAKVALAVLRGERPDDVSGRPIRGAYACWGRYARAIRRFPGVDREPGPGSNWIEIVTEPGPPPETMEGPACGAGEPGVEVRAGRCFFDEVGPGRLDLGDRDRVDVVRVIWPDGRLTAHGPFEANTKIVIRESDT